MKNFVSIYLLSFVLFGFTTASKDRIAQPSSYDFVFENNTKITIVSKQDQRLKKYNDHIIAHKLKLKTATLSFDSGEKITFKHDGKKWSNINIKYLKKEIAVPSKVLSKINEIDFTTVCLLWSGDKEKAFNAAYCYIQFDTGTKKFYDKLPYLQLAFKKGKFSNAELWTQVDENTTKGKII